MAPKRIRSAPVSSAASGQHLHTAPLTHAGTPSMADQSPIAGDAAVFSLASSTTASSSNSVVSVPPPPPGPVDVDAFTAPASTAPPERPTHRATRQMTLAGEVLGTPTPLRATHSSSVAATYTDTHATGDAGGDGRAQTRMKRTTRKRPASALPPDSLAAAPLLEESLLKHLRSALALDHVRAAGSVVELSTHTLANHTTDAAHTLAAMTGQVEEDSFSDGSVSASGDHRDAAVADGANTVVMRAALPCVQYFILSECARLARVVREQGGCGYGDDPATRAAELFQFLLSMADRNETFSGLLAMACPACRLGGVSNSAVVALTQFLVLTQRVALEEVFLLDQASLMACLGVSRDGHGGRRPPLAALDCCPYGEAHVALHLLCTSASGQSTSCVPRVRWQYVPFDVLALPVALAVGRNVEFVKSIHTGRSAAPHPQHASATSQGGGRTRAPRAARRGAGPVPRAAAAQPPNASPAGQLSWAEEVLHVVVPETAKEPPWHRDAHDHQSRIRRCYAYTCADGGRGGYFTATLELPSAVWQSTSLSSVASTSALIAARLLFAHMQLCQHMADGLRRGATCTCQRHHEATAASFLFVEEHCAYTAALRRRRDEEYLLVHDEVATTGGDGGAAVDVDAASTESNGQNRVSFYAAGSFARFMATLELTASMSGAQVVDYVARVTAESLEALPAVQVPLQYIQAQLKRHQLENVQWMWSKECDGYREHVSAPLYHIADTAGAALTARQVGVMYYCAATNELIVVRGSGTSTAAAVGAGESEWDARSVAGRRIRGGLLCDDVGLGKTLSVLTLCAYDRAVREASSHNNSEKSRAQTASDAEVALLARRYWQVSAKSTVQRHGSLSLRPGVLSWAFGPFHSGVATHPVAPARLPRTTLIVVPLSIAPQWIEEIRKFYPAASYILFYGARRAQYTVDDLRRADFVITTYETLSTHLRQEADGLRFWTASAADEADDAVCAKAAARGWLNLLPTELVEAVRGHADDVVWPAADDGTGGVCRRTSRQVVLTQSTTDTAETTAAVRGRGNAGACHSQHRGKAGKLVPPRAGATADASSGTWTVERSAAGDVPVFHCPAFSITLAEADDNAPTAASADPRAWPSAVSDALLDGVWELLKGYSAAAAVGSSVIQAEVLQFSLFGRSGSHHTTMVVLARLFDAAETYVLPDSTRRELVRWLLLPPLYDVLAGYWADMKAHYADVAAAETSTRRPPLRVTDLLFRRIVLDESQKCGAASLFHLLNGERRWAVTGTPLNNNKTESLGLALRFLGMRSAARQLSKGGLQQGFLVHTCFAAHAVEHSSATRFIASSMIRAVFCLAALRNTAVSLTDTVDSVSFCVCPMCWQRCVYGITDAAVSRVPAELRRWTAPTNFQAGLPCLPNTLLEVLALTMVRHGRDEQVSRELQLPPVRYLVHTAVLAEDEMLLYDRVARVIMAVAARLHRQGVLTARMGLAMQWVQDLCRLCLHPSRVGNAALLHGNVEAHVLRGLQYFSDNSDGDVVLAEALTASFVAATPQEALVWAKSVAAARKPGSLISPGVPEETAASLAELAQVPPLLPQCGVCMDDMVAPTLLQCFHMFCKECVLGVIDASRSVAGNVTAKCPYCRNRKSMLEEKRVVMVTAAPPPEASPEVGLCLNDGASVPAAVEAQLSEAEVDAMVARVGCGSRVLAFVAMVEEVWRVHPDDGVLVFSKYPAFLQMAYDAVVARGYAPQMVQGSSSMAQRQRAIRAMQPSVGSSDAVTPPSRRILFVTSRSANAGLNLTFANHVVFLEPNPNPAMEQQAIGRVHRFGQLKQVTVHHLFAPHTIEEVMYRRSVRLRQEAAQAPQAAAQVPELSLGSTSASEVQRRTHFGRIAPNEILMLLEYPVPQ